MMRAMLYEAAQILLVRSAKWSSQGLGDEDCQAPRAEKGDRGLGAPIGRDHAPHLGRRHRIPMDQGSRRNVNTHRGSKQIGET